GREAHDLGVLGLLPMDVEVVEIAPRGAEDDHAVTGLRHGSSPRRRGVRARRAGPSYVPAPDGARGDEKAPAPGRGGYWTLRSFGLRGRESPRGPTLSFPRGPEPPGSDRV